MKILKDENLARHSNYRIGGRAKIFIEAESPDDFIQAVKFAKKNGKYFIIGGGTNILFGDMDIDGTIIKVCLKGIERQSEEVSVSAGVLMADLLDYCVENSLSGLEWAGGLPGTVGGAIRGNAGAFGGEIKNLLSTVRSLDTGSFETRERSCSECLFNYRDSIFKHNEEIILGGIFKLSAGDQGGISKAADKNILYRKKYQPLEYPSAGSTFKNIPVASVSKNTADEFAGVIKVDPFPVIPVAAVLSSLGLKAIKIGGAEISDKHPNFFINKNNASSADILALIRLAKQKAWDKYKIVLEEEIQVIV